MSVPNQRRRVLRRQAQKLHALGSVAMGVAHDLNNTLAAITGFTELALGQLPDDSPARAELVQVLASTARSAEMVSRILSFGQPDKTGGPVDAAFEVSQSLDLVRAVMPSTVLLKRRINPDAGHVATSSGRLHQVVLNLCTNAFQAMTMATGSRGTGRLEVGVTSIEIEDASKCRVGRLHPGRYVKLVFADSGPGVDPFVLGEIFEPFVSTREEDTVTGIGLAIVSETVKGLGGAIEVESKLGAGSEFVVYLPRTQAAAPCDPPEIVRAKSRWRRQHVLVVDDEAPIKELATRQLEGLGYRATACSGGLEALRVAAEDRSVRLILADATMPNASGLEIAKKLAKDQRSPKVLLMSGLRELISQHADTGFAVGVLGKPFSLAELGHAVDRALNGVRPTRKPWASLRTEVSGRRK